jgi:hypothetical protein
MVAELCGRVKQVQKRYAHGETGEGAHISLLTGRATAAKQTVTTTKAYSWEPEYVFPPSVFMQLQNGQAVALAYDGLNPWFILRGQQRWLG